MNDHHLTAGVAVAIGFVLGGFIATLSSAVVLIGAITALFSAAAREGAVLFDRNERGVRRATAVGFFVGLGIGLFLVGVGALQA